MGKSNYTRAFAVVTTLFFMWGFITVLVDSLIPRLREIFELSYGQAFFVQFAFFIAYGLVSIPAGHLLSRIGYKRGIMAGLGVMGLGCLLFYPAAAIRSFPIFLAGYFILASGMTILQVAANPYVAVLGDESTASSRLNLSQAFNSVGTAIAPAIGALFILSDHILNSDEIGSLTEADKLAYFESEASAVQSPFLLLAGSLLVLTLIVGVSKLPQVLNKAVTGGYKAAFRQKKLMLGAVGIFLYVGAEVAIGSALVNYFIDMDSVTVIRQSKFMTDLATMLHGSLSAVDDKGIVAVFVVFYWSGAMVGRFVGALLTRRFAPDRVLMFFGLAAAALILVSMSTSGLIAMWSILLVGLFNSIMFPTIFTIAIEGLGDLKPQGSGILCTAIAGGAFVPPLYGVLTDLSSFKIAFILIICCYLYITWYARSSTKLVEN